MIFALYIWKLIPCETLAKVIQQIDSKIQIEPSNSYFQVQTLMLNHDGAIPI